MSNPEKVVDLLKKTGEAHCDDCLGNKLAINRHQVHTIASTLALTPAFRRALTVCPQGCSERAKLVTSYIFAPQDQREAYGCRF